MRLTRFPGGLPALVALAVGLAAPASATAQAPPLDPETRFTMALQHLRDGRVETAIEEIKRAIKEDSKNPYFHKGLGLAYMEAGERAKEAVISREYYGQAIEAFRKALDLNPYYTDVRNDLGTALMLAGRREEGKKELLTAFNDPTYNAPEVAARNLGQAAFEEKKYEEALKWYRTAAERNPKYADAWLGLADVYVVLGRPDEAVAQLEAAQRQLPDSIGVRLGFGEACYRAGRFNEARAALEEVARKDPAGPAGRRAAELLKDFPR